MNEVIKFFQELDMGEISLFLALISLFLGLISIGFGILAIYFIRINIKALIKQNENALEQNEIAKKSECNERFKNAIEQLGDEKNAIVLGGIYTLHRIAKDDESYRENVSNILCAFVRETTTTQKYQEISKRTAKKTTEEICIEFTFEKPSEPIQTILNIFCRNKEDFKIYNSFKIDFSGAYLKSVNLSDANLSDANLSDVNLTSANLSNADLTMVNLSDANLTGASLFVANLTNANLANADLTGTDLRFGDFTGTDLRFSDLTGADLAHATLIDANLDKAILKGVYSSENIVYKSFEERIKSRTDKPTDLSGINGGYYETNKRLKGKPIPDKVYTKEEADEIIIKYNKNKKR